MNPHALEPSVPWPKESIFAHRVHEEQKGAKRHVAVQVAEQFLPPGTSAFIADGSSTFWVGLAAFVQAREAADAGRAALTQLFTVNLGLQDEYAFGPNLAAIVRLIGGAGETHPSLFTVWGDETLEFVVRAVKRSRTAILAVNALSAHRGPFGVDEQTNPIKKTAMAAVGADQKLVLVTDHTKLALLPSKARPRPLEVADADWKELRAKRNVFVVTTRFPGAPVSPPSGLPEDATDSRLEKLSDPDRYTFQAHYLKLSMGDRFIECPACNCLAE